MQKHINKNKMNGLYHQNKKMNNDGFKINKNRSTLRCTEQAVNHIYVEIQKLHFCATFLLMSFRNAFKAARLNKAAQQKGFQLVFFLNTRISLMYWSLVVLKDGEGEWCE
ncbi:unnamed protein product [Schistosoma rodhaini]|nr:unnamed protein product [Schistosoma rodhaini]